MHTINLREKFSRIKKHWDPKIVGELNGQHVKLVKFAGEFDWHQHKREDELFLVIDGSLTMQFRDKSVTVNAGEFIIVPRETDHNPKADQEAQVLLFEPKGTINTGNTKSDRTILHPEDISSD
jgi:mannose-6-phosphate isomerase-like protein (cupin superfamily)